jgi:hypothetical protein
MIGRLWLALIHWFASLLTCRIIPAEDGQVYLERYRIFGWLPGSNWNGPSLYLHRFRLPDQDSACHNHPWSFAVSCVIAGGYWERLLQRVGDETVEQVRQRLPFSTCLLRSSTYHVVEALIGVETWTIFLTAPKSGSWGFWIPDRGHVPWRDRLRERGIPVDG